MPKISRSHNSNSHNPLAPNQFKLCPRILITHPIAIHPPPRYSSGAMANRLQRLTSCTLPMASLLALVIGPAAAAAEARYALQAWTSKAEAAAKSAAARSPASDKSENTKSQKKGSSGERTFSSFFAPASAKPNETQSKPGNPLVAGVSEAKFHSLSFCFVVRPSGTLSRPTLQWPPHRAHAPPRA